MEKTKILRNIPFVILSFSVISCIKDQPMELTPEDILHRNQDQLTQVIIYDMFSPPVASRIYMYSSLAAFETIRFQKAGTLSIAENLAGFDSLPLPDAGKSYDFNLAASKAFFDVVHKVRVFSVDSLKKYEDFLYDYYASRLDDSTYKWSVSFGKAVADKILKRAAKDGYTFSRGKPKYLGSNEPGKWKTTPPDYLDGSEAYWNTIQPVSIDSASCFRPGPPPVFSLDTGSVFFRSVREVYHIYKNLTDEQMLIATYWDDNPLVFMHSGHMMFANKKITPGGHWMGICAIASKQTGADAVQTAAAYALTSIALFDGFIACWNEKYNSHFIRPVTVINETIDPTWMPYLQTPPFPEYPSGHSTITAAAATVLTSIFGDNFAFRDTSDLRYIGLERNFRSFNEAAAEASISRVYGGIHFRFSIDSGAVLGNRLGEHIINKLRVKPDDLAGR
jgi:membrane-associated phospholipid phosphatase